MKKSKLKIEIKKNTKKNPHAYEIYNWYKKIIKNSHIKLYIKIVNKKEIKLTNKKYKNINKTTNILAFTNNKKKQNNILGNIIICAPIIENEYRLLKINKKKYWCKIIIHGILHLLKYNHNTYKKEKIMKKKENLLLNNIFKKQL